MPATKPAPTLRLTSPGDVLAAVPYLVGFHPERSLVVIGCAGRLLRVTTRWDLPAPPGTFDGLMPMLARERTTTVILAGYGPGSAVTPAIDAVTRLARARGLRVNLALRAHEGRYWSYGCERADCCPPEGTAYDVTSSLVAAEAVALGMVALPDRETLRKSIANVPSPAMTTATRRAEDAVRVGLTPPEDAPRRLVAEGIANVRGALAQTREGRALTDDHAARLAADLLIIRVRDEAWTAMDADDAHLTLWSDLTRRALPGYVAPAASLLAAAAWRGGNFPLAAFALARARADDPAYSMANLLAMAIHEMLPAASLHERMPPPAQLDAAMGEPQWSWLAPLLKVLGPARKVG